jgi:hypothetical protein
MIENDPRTLAVHQELRVAREEGLSKVFSKKIKVRVSDV